MNEAVTLGGVRQDYPGNIRRKRLALGMTLAATARGAGTTPAQVMKLENGDRRLTLEWVERLAVAFGCPALELIAPPQDLPRAGAVRGDWSIEPQAAPDMTIQVPGDVAQRTALALSGGAWLPRAVIAAGAFAPVGELTALSGQLAVLQLAPDSLVLRRVTQSGFADVEGRPDGLSPLSLAPVLSITFPGAP